MNPRIKTVKTQGNYQLLLKFDNDETGVFDVKPYINKGFFNQLQDKKYFKTVRPHLGSIVWENGQDFCPDTLYLNATFNAILKK